MLKLSDIEITEQEGHVPYSKRFTAKITMGAEFITSPENIDDIPDFREGITKDLKQVIVQGVYGEISDDIVRIGQRVMGEVKDPAVSADIYADLEILYEKLNQYES